MSTALSSFNVSSFLNGNLSSDERDAFLRSWDTAFVQEGAIILTGGHGVTNALVNSLLTEAEDWFRDTPMDAKKQWNFGPYGNSRGGYSWMGMEAVAASLRGKAAAQHIDPVESFVFRGRPSSSSSSSSSSSPCSLFPHADEYYVRMQGLLRVIHKICCEALGIADPSYFAAIYGDENHVDALRIAHYPPDLSSGPVVVMGARESAQEAGKEQEEEQGELFPGTPRPRLRYGAHTDYLDITILKPDYSDWRPLTQPLQPTATGTGTGAGADADEGAGYQMTTGGLQILRRGCDPSTSDEQEWFPVKIHHDAAAAPEQEVPLVVNIGDLWNIWSASRWQSPVHRVTHEVRARVAAAATATATATATAMDGGKHAAKLSSPPTSTAPAQPSPYPRARQSLVFFGLPMESALIKPLKGSKIDDFTDEVTSAVEGPGQGLDSCAESGAKSPYHPSRFTPILAGQHLLEKISRSNA